ncbi:TetR/AcrR family transcriptional regulator [Paenibacillus sp. JTLBN-2024]
MIYNYFGSKEALIREVFRDYAQGAIDEFEPAAPRELHVEGKDRIHHFAKETKFPHLFHPSVLAELMQEDPEIREIVRRKYEEQGLPLMAELVGKAKGKRGNF